jgi:hypothetical protein
MSSLSRGPANCPSELSESLPSSISSSQSRTLSPWLSPSDRVAAAAETAWAATDRVAAAADAPPAWPPPLRDLDELWDIRLAGEFGGKVQALDVSYSVHMYVRTYVRTYHGTYVVHVYVRNFPECHSKDAAKPWKNGQKKIGKRNRFPIFFFDVFQVS